MQKYKYYQNDILSSNNQVDEELQEEVEEVEEEALFIDGDEEEGVGDEYYSSEGNADVDSYEEDANSVLQEDSYEDEGDTEEELEQSQVQYQTPKKTKKEKKSKKEKTGNYETHTITENTSISFTSNKDKTLLPNSYLIVDFKDSKVDIIVIVGGIIKDIKEFSEGSILDNENRYSSLDFHLETILNIADEMASAYVIEQRYCFLPTKHNVIAKTVESLEAVIVDEDTILYKEVNCFINDTTGKVIPLNAYSLVNKKLLATILKRNYKPTTRYISIIDFIQHHPNKAVIDNLYSSTCAYFAYQGNVYVNANLKYSAKAAVDIQYNYDRKSNINFKTTVNKVRGLSDSLLPNVQDILQYNILQMHRMIPKQFKDILVYDEFTALPWEVIKGKSFYDFNIAMLPVDTFLYSQKTEADAKAKKKKASTLIMVLILTIAILSIVGLQHQKQLLDAQTKLIETLQEEAVVYKSDLLMETTLNCVKKCNLKLVKMTRITNSGVDELNLYFSKELNLNDFIELANNNGLAVSYSDNAEYNQILRITLINTDTP